MKGVSEDIERVERREEEKGEGERRRERERVRERERERVRGEWSEEDRREEISLQYSNLMVLLMSLVCVIIISSEGV